MKKYLGIILLALSFQAQAAIVSLLENWNDFSDWTLGTLSNPVRFTSQSSVTSFGHNFLPTETDKLLRISGGFTSREPSLIYKQFSFGNGDILAFDWFTVYRDAFNNDDGTVNNDATYFLLSTDAVNFLAYQLTDGLTLGGVAGAATGWNTSYLQFAGSGDLYVGFAAIDYGREAGAIFFGTDNLRLVDSIPTSPPSVGGDVDQIARYDFGNGGGQPPVSAVPEPASAMLMLTGLLGIGYLRRRKSDTSDAMHV